MTAALSDPAPTSMLDRFTVIIDCFAGGAHLLTLDEIAGRTCLPRSSAHRILDQLVRLGWLTHCVRGYGLGVRALPSPAGDLRLRTAAAPSLHRLLMRTGAVVHLGAVDRGDVVYLDKLGGSAAERVPTAVGARAPAHRVALGIAALSAMSPEDVETALEQGGSGFQPGPRWWAEVHRARDGVAVRDGDHAAGMASAAAAVGAGASVGIVIETSRFTHRHRSLVVAAAAEIRTVLRRG